MTALDDAIAKADEVLALDEKVTPHEWRVGPPDRIYIVLNGRHVDLAHFVLATGPYNAASAALNHAAAPDLARALKAVAEALMDVDPYAYHHPDQATTVIAVVTDIRAAIERRLGLGGGDGCGTTVMTEPGQPPPLVNSSGGTERRHQAPPSEITNLEELEALIERATVKIPDELNSFARSHAQADQREARELLADGATTWIPSLIKRIRTMEDITEQAFGRFHDHVSRSCASLRTLETRLRQLGLLEDWET